MNHYPSPSVTVDLIIVDSRNRLVLIERKNYPFGWALPGGFVDLNESCENAAVREALEETSLHVELVQQLHTYSDPGRDPRKHTVSVIYEARVIKGELKAADDAKNAGWYDVNHLPEIIAFDHREIISDFTKRKCFHGPGQ